MGRLFAPRGEPCRESGSLAVSGYRLAEFGWLGPLELCFAWYAHLPLASCVVKLLRGLVPSFRLAVVALVLAATVLIPHVRYSEVDGWHMHVHIERAYVRIAVR